MAGTTRRYFLWLFLFFLMAAEVLTWQSVRHVKDRWANVPPVPSMAGAMALSLGDGELAYRSLGLMLQNLGSTGGRTESFINYDYDKLSSWFFLARSLNGKANFVPFLAAYYYGAVEDPEKLRLLIPYLEAAGQDGGAKKWRWLAQAVYLARYKIKDLDLAYRLASELAALPDQDLPAWARQMPAFVLTAKGDRQEAYDFMVATLKSSAGKMPDIEMNFMKHYICTKILLPAQADVDPLCRDIKW